MKISHSLKGLSTRYGPGIDITLDGNEIAEAIDQYLAARGVTVKGARTTSINEIIARDVVARIYVDPSGSVGTPDGSLVQGDGKTIDPSASFARSYERE